MNIDMSIMDLAKSLQIECGKMRSCIDCSLHWHGCNNDGLRGIPEGWSFDEFVCEEDDIAEDKAIAIEVEKARKVGEYRNFDLDAYQEKIARKIRELEWK